ncbi:MAG: DUF5615 family PIN-like protein [Deltaproteobacteria bacterium]|nr:DUF5615 family PIN-like protein [Deltaproteobacteria bacterium]
MARLYADENFPHPVVLELRRLGHNVLTIQEAGKSGQKIPDETVLADATKEGRSVLTHNRQDFIHLHNIHPEHTGIIGCTADLDFDGLAKRIDTAIQSHEALVG